MRAFPVHVTATNPLTVTFPDGSTQKALGIAGLSYSTSGSYIALHQEGGIAVIYPVGAVTGTDSVIDGNV